MGSHLGRIKGGHSEGWNPSSTVHTMTDEVSSGEKREISSCISETAMSFVAALAPAPSESRVMEKVSKQLYSSTDLGTLQREDGSCRFTVEGPHLLASTLDRTFESNMGHYEANPCRLQLGPYHSDYGWDRNRPTTVMSKRLQHMYLQFYTTTLEFHGMS